MTTLQHEITIDASIENVWKAVADLSAVQHYNPMVSSVRCLSDQSEGVGAARRCELKPKGWVEERVWEWTPPNAIGLEVVASEWPLVFMKWKTELRANGNSTVVTQKNELQNQVRPPRCVDEFAGDATQTERDHRRGLRESQELC